MTRDAYNKYRREWRKRAGKKCLCGNEATLTKWGDPVCVRCNELENLQDSEYRRQRAVDGGLTEHEIEHEHKHQYQH